METENKKFYTCKNDRTFKEVFLKEENSDLLKALLETILKIEIDKIEIKKTELLSGNINIKDKRVDAIIYTNNKKIEIEVNSENKEYLHSRNTAYICNMYQAHTLSGEYYNEETDIIQINLTWGLGKKEKEKREYMIRDEEGERFVKNLKIYEINMDYYSNVWYSKNEEEIEKKKYMIMLNLEKKELETMPKDKIVDKYITNVIVVNNDPEFMSYMSEEEDKRKIQNSLYNESREKGYNSGLKKGIKEGLKEGISKGKEEGKKEGIEQGSNNKSIEIARNMLNKNMKIEEISELTGLSIEKIKCIKK